MKKDSKKLIEEATKRAKADREKQKVRLVYKLDNFVYWTSLVLLALFNLVACFFLIPFLMFFSGFYLYLTVACFGLIFGFLFNLLIMGIEHLEQKHHLIAGLFIPALAVIDIVIILRIVERINQVLVRPVTYNTGQIVIIFIFAFVAPYLFTVITRKQKLKS